MLQFFVDHQLGYLGIVLFLALCGCGIPIPEEVPLVLAGVLSSQGTLDPWMAFSSCLIGALLGDSVMYMLGRYFGHAWLTKHPSLARFIDSKKEEKFEHAVHRHGFKMLVLTRFLVGVRGPVYFAAGAAKVPYLRFLLWDLIGATIVVAVIFGLGYKFGNGIAKIIGDAEEVATAVVVLGLMSAGIYFLYKKQTARVAEALEDITEKDLEEAAHEREEERIAASGRGAQPIPSTNGALASESDQPNDVSM
ncbi:DedA family protein [Botrimarina mediterranea]|uniref:Inner membrane protein YohD n=1 Tax=Botrimarina mediterranea TaxID=2528022 RepID=A0A518K5F6_9BACT|nr:DedA family protein [Botrimarina mediterranea]QDV73024.1 Inner membrane protein YohD [Botrimarina mediterranea]QDV77598.1 Inner membrane protein YohD [Planctomycetes bacterium K2D]